MTYFFDTYAIVEIINQNPSYLKFKNELIITNALNLAEIYYFFLKNYNEQTADYWAKNLNCEFLEITPEISIEAARLKYMNKKLKLSYADCIGYVTSLKNGMGFLTGDKGFADLEGVEFVK